MPQVYWQRCADLVRRSAGLSFAAGTWPPNQLIKDLSYAIPSVQQELSTIAERAAAPAGDRPAATMHDIYQDLVALRQEFEQLDLRLQRTPTLGHYRTNRAGRSLSGSV